MTHAQLLHLVRQTGVIGLIVIVFASFAPLTHGADRFAITITPPLFKVSLKPGDRWASTIKVVNTNEVDMSVYGIVKDFTAEGEEGATHFVPVMKNDRSGATLGSWITLSDDALRIPAQKTGEIAFTITVPMDAAPGGHYAAILIGPRAGSEDQTPGAQVSIASYVTALFLVRIEGDVTEAGSFREFSTDQTLYEEPTARFNIRFENRGNVHLQPQGNVFIYNMWGKERGRIDINEGSNFGNVLPGTTRKFVFDWTSEADLFEIGKYTAVATLTFGETAHQNVSRSVSFWVIPIVPTMTVVGGFLLIIFTLIWGIRRYVRRALALELTARGGASRPARPLTPIDAFPALRALDPGTLIGPLEEGYRDLTIPDRPPLGKLLKKYTLLFFVFLPLFLIGTLWLLGFFSSVLSEKRAYEVNVPTENAGSIKNQ